MTRAHVLLLIGVALAACEPSASGPPGDAGTDAGPPDGGPTCTELVWDPASGNITRWPEPRLVRSDPTTETGIRLVFDPVEYATLADRLRGYRATLTDDLSEVDGFGIHAEAFFMFRRAFDLARVPSGDATREASAGLGFVVVEPGPPRLVPVIVDTTDGDATLLLAPMEPLPPRARVAANVARALTQAAGDCLEPSSAMAASIAALDADAQAAIDALRSLGVIAAASELVALTAFPTQSVLEDAQAVVADLEARDRAWQGPRTCTDETRYVVCEGAFAADDYRDATDGVFRRARGAPATPTASYVLPVTVWLPPASAGPGPHPTLVFGHGLIGDRGQARRLAEFAAPLGIATIAIDAVEHGDHPTTAGEEGTSLARLFAFFGIGDLATRALAAARLRDNFRQSAWDKLQLTRLITSQPDVDGDGAPDLDPTRLAYLGVSLGGIMGPELLALSGAYGAGVLVVPGGRTATIISDSSTFAPLVAALRPRDTSEGDVRRFFPIVQTIIERGDAATFGGHLLRDRLPSADRVTPSILVGVVLDDDIVPNVANYTLARAIGVPIVEPVLRPEPGLVSVPPVLSGNFAAGAATGGLLQFDVVGVAGGGTETATHNNIGASDVGADAWLDFLTSHWDGLARVRDPYVAIGLPHAM